MLGGDITDRTLLQDLQSLKEKGHVDKEVQFGQKTKSFLLEPGHSWCPGCPGQIIH